MAFKIENGIPLPRRSKFPFKEMKVGDSFAFGPEDAVSVRSMAYCTGTRSGMKFQVKSGRCWRVS